MSLATNLQNLVTRIATEFKSVRTLINGNSANLNGLTTTAKTNLVAAVNEVKAIADSAASSGGASINDALTTTSTVWSSSKTDAQIGSAVAGLVASAPGTLDTLAELATALGDDPNFATTMTGLIGGKADAVHAHAVADVTGLQTALNGKAASTHSHTAAEISNATAIGRSVLTAATPADARTAIGAGTSSLAIGTTASTAAAGNDARLSDARTPLAHSHAVSDVTGLQAALDAKAPTTLASLTVAGLVELATNAEAAAGSDAVRAITPAALRAVTGDVETNLVAAFEAALV